MHAHGPIGVKTFVRDGIGPKVWDTKNLVIVARTRNIKLHNWA